MVGTWDNSSPDGTKSTKTNVPIMLSNTQYNKANLTLDHYWDVGANEDGSHRFVQAPKHGGGTPTDPTLRTGMDSIYYPKEKTAAEAVAQQDVQPFFLTSATAVMQLLGIRAMILFDGSGGATLKYAHNATIARTAEGLFTVTFTNALPSADYLVLGGGMPNNADTSSSLVVSVAGASALATSKTTALCKIVTRLNGSSAHDPLQAWVIMFGG